MYLEEKKLQLPSIMEISFMKPLNIYCELGFFLSSMEALKPPHFFLHYFLAVIWVAT